MLITKSRRQRGIQRLLSAPLDLALSGAPVWDGRGAKPDGKHNKLFAAYMKDLGKAVPKAMKFWQELAEDDEKMAWRTRPAGPASDPRFVALIRQYWLACHELNQTLAPSQRVPPEVFLLEWLVDTGKQNLIDVLACMPYWPIGMDKSGNWC